MKRGIILYTSSSGFSIITNQYLTCFEGILNRMISGMTRANLTNSISHNFIVQMIPHHRGAIEMSKNLLRYTTCIPLQEIALGIIREQTESIRNMEHILRCCARIKNTRQELSCYQNNFHEITRTMFSDMENACKVNDINASFMYEMIPHHMGAVKMSQSALNFPICSGLNPILEAIISSQEKGIRQMEELLSQINEGLPH